MDMSLNHSDLYAGAEDYVSAYLDQWLPKTRYFHNIDHTRQVVAQCQAMATAYALPVPDVDVLLLAAWFHDVGYCFGSTDHEESSIAILLSFLSDYHMPEKSVAGIEQLILATEMGFEPEILLEKIICDADSWHLGSPDYFTWSDKLQKEVASFERKDIADRDWNKGNIAFFQAHQYYTDYAIKNWSDQKRVNLDKLVEKVK
jgi:predicted metal-dependent HD superfamily phosphohydrolase